MRIFLKSATILLLLPLYAVVSLGIRALPASRVRRRELLVANVSFFARLGLRILGIRLHTRRLKHTHGHIHPMHHLILSNHVSYTDILIIASLLPSVFITSVELKRTFPLGFLAWCGGSLFVERRSPAGLKREIGEIAQALSEGASVALFPEGTTSDGDTVRPFKNSLLTAAISTGTSILPVCIRYLAANGHPIDATDRDSVFYYGGTTFFEHIPRLLALRSLVAECIILQPVAVDRHSSRKDLAAQAHAVILAAYHEGRSDRQRSTGTARGTTEDHS